MPIPGVPIKELSKLVKPEVRRVYNLTGSSAALLLSLQEEPFLVVEQTEESARLLWQDVNFYIKLLHLEKEVLYLPPPDTPESAGLRAAAVSRLTGSAVKAPAGLVTSADAEGSILWDPGRLRDAVVTFRKGAEINRDDAEAKLVGLGYTRVPLATERGQYSRRGFILDIFPATSDVPGRVEFFGDVVEGIRIFDVETQRSVAESDTLVLFPAREAAEGVTLCDVAGSRRRFAAESANGEVTEGPVCLSRFSIAGEGVDAGVLPIAGLGVLPEERKGLDEISRAIRRIATSHSVVMVSSSHGQAERIRDILRDGDVIAPILPLGQIRDYMGAVSISVGELSSGVFLEGLLLLTEMEVFGGRPAYRALKKSRVARLLTSLDDLEAGDFVVHEDHGIGKFLGLMRQSIEGGEYDLLAIDYAGGERLYLPPQKIGKIRKYHSEEASVPKLDSLGTRAWQRTKERVRKRVREMARKLMKLYAQREVTKGTPFSADTEMHREFDSFFPYEETSDQIRAIREIKEDMESPRPMERLLAGDVGYGKTEVAMRAAFKAVYDGKQVAVLVPTTLLCEQHFRIFTKRFSAFPVNVDYLSRFKTKAGQRRTLEKLARGDIDIIIATHALLRGDASFYNLGLLVVDEEHRFGVRQKEIIKELRAGVDVLSMSATPIPRTLQMSLSGIRKMSVIETPPEERLAVKSSVSAFGLGLIREAIEKELARGGQVFFVHNRIKDIEKIAHAVRRQVPQARVAVAHGRMRERDLEKIMLRFLNMETDVLVSTAIVGSGLDIPTANTIVVDMADKMGLADLYQLKGRVGRSNVKGYAHFMIPGENLIKDDARKRLQALQEMNYMGAGLRLAMKDLEIRGAGNLLGAEQSGYINAVGFDMYIDMLERAVSELKGIEVKEGAPSSVSLRIKAYIPDSYIDDMALRLSVYRSVASARSPRDLDALKDDMTDRFGKPPETFVNLLRVMKLRLMAEKVSVSNISQSDGRIKFILSDAGRLTPESILMSFGRGVRFHRDGFEVPIKGSPYASVKKALTLLGKASHG